MLAVATMLSLALAADPPKPVAPTLPVESLAGRPGVTGEVLLHRDMRSSAGDGLLPRHVSVWLPPGYALPENASRRYPVLYMHDGQNAFDPATAFRVTVGLLSASPSLSLKVFWVLHIFRQPHYKPLDKCLRH